MKSAIIAVFVLALLFLPAFSLSQEAGSGNVKIPGDPGSTNYVTGGGCQNCCQDGTRYGECSVTKPLYCWNGALKHNCSACGCGQGYECADNGHCIKSTAECKDGTANGNCSENRPLYCDNGKLLGRCPVCGCREGEDCLSEGTCYFNHRPGIVRIGEVEAEEGRDISLKILENEKLEFYVVAEDEDGDTLKYYVVNAPAGSAFNSETGLFSWTPGYETAIRQFYVSFFAVDIPAGGNPKTSGQNVWIYIGDVNRIPVIGFAEELLKTDENVLLEFELNAEDPDGDEMAYYAEGLPKGAEFDNRTAKFSWVPEFGQEGNYVLNFTVSDGVDSATKKITVTVGDVNRLPKSKISYPLENQEFLTERNTLFSGADSYDPDGEELTYSWDFGDGKTMVTRNSTTTHAYKNPGTYEVGLTVTDGKMYDTDSVTIAVKESLVKDSDNDGVEDSLDRCPDTPPLKMVNVHGCSLPKYTEFQNNLTTDFSKADMINATNVTLGIPEKGKIEFRENTLNILGRDLDKYVEIGYANVTINTDNIPELNKSAVITFYNVTIKDPVIVRDEVHCDDCRMISYLNKTFSFSVPHFTTYSLMAWASYSGYCGDGLCSLYESCQECREDCGECKEAKPPKMCEEFWVCSGWSECNELDLRTRECVDVNLCGLQSKKPAETVECGKEEEQPSLLFLGIIVMFLVLAYLLAETYKKRKETKRMDNIELERFVKGYIYRGYSTGEIRKMLESKGYREDEIEKVLREVKKGIF